MPEGFSPLTVKDLQTPEGLANLNRMISLLFDLVAGDGVDQRVYSGYSAPTGAATTGSLYLRLDGGANTSVYVMEGSTWTAK